MAKYKSLAAAVWGNCSAKQKGAAIDYGAGHIYCTLNAHEVLESMNITPDFTYKSADPNAAFDFVHRRTANAEIYFVRNEKDVPVKATWIFRVTGRTPELFDTETGKTTPAMVYRVDGKQTEVPLDIPALGSTFVIFQHPVLRHAVSLERDGQPVFPSMVQGTGVYGSSLSGGALYAAQSNNCHVQFSDGTQEDIQFFASGGEPVLHSPWTVTFPPGWGAPSSVKMTSLRSWTDSPIPGVRYFSGTATYHNTIHVSAKLLDRKREIWMDLGDVREIATVEVNGRQLRTLWHAPFVVRIDPALHTGENELSIQVTNLWPNRLIGDQQPSETVHYTRTNIHIYDKDSPLLPSGLLSPVKLWVDGEGKR